MLVLCCRNCAGIGNYVENVLKYPSSDSECVTCRSVIHQHRESWQILLPVHSWWCRIYCLLEGIVTYFKYVFSMQFHHGRYLALSLSHQQMTTCSHGWLVCWETSPFCSCNLWNLWMAAVFPFVPSKALMHWGTPRAWLKLAVSSSTLDSVKGNCIYTQGPSGL